MDKHTIDYSLNLVTDEQLLGHKTLSEAVEKAVEGGCTMVQLREKNINSTEFLTKALRIKTSLKEYDIPLIINDYPQIALKCGADGVHLGQSDMNPTKARKLLGNEAIIGLSVETMEHVDQAKSQPVDYLGVSPVFGTPTKTDTGTPWGLEGLKTVRSKVNYPLVAIGGIKHSNVQQVIRAGADGVAVISAICGRKYVRAAARRLKICIDESKKKFNSVESYE